MLKGYIKISFSCLLGKRCLLLTNYRKINNNVVFGVQVDSVMALFRVDFSGRGELADRQQKLGQMMSRLQKISEEYNVAVFITNQMTSDPGATMSFQV